MSLRLLITGAGGFVGSAVARIARARGHTVTGLDKQPAPDADDFVIGDVTDSDVVAGLAQSCDVLIHCAAIVGPSPATADPELATHSNIDGTLALLEAARRHNQRLVCLSTATLYGNDPTLSVHDENDRPDPVGLYDATKLMAETLCEAYRTTFGVDVTSIRTSFVYGPRHSTGDYFVARCLTGETAISGLGRDHPCEFTYVDDLARGIVLAAEAADLPNPVYNIAAGITRTRGELARIVMAEFPGVEIDLAAGFDPGRHLRGPCRIDRALADFGFKPEFTLETGVRYWIEQARAVSP